MTRAPLFEAVKGRVRSADGTTIGYRCGGSGPGLILVHGGMLASQHFTKLAAALSSDYTVHVPDRRGRGLSGPHGDDYASCARVLLMRGACSAAYFGVALRSLADVLPHARSVTLPGAGRTAPENDGAPLAVAAHLRDFLAAP